MSPTLGLDERQLAAALGLLRREQRDFLPSRGEILRFRFFNVATALIVVLLVALNLAPEGAPARLLFWVLAAIALANISLFLSNAGLIRKFWRIARLRRRLGLTRRLAPFFGRRQGPAGRMLMYLGAAVCIAAGVFCLGFFLFLLAPDSRQALLADPGVGGVPGFLLIELTLFFLSVGLLSAPLMWRARKRLEIVTGLESSLLTEQRPGTGPAEEAAFAAVATNVLSEMERSQIIRERQRLMHQAKRQKAAGHALQRSMDVHRAKARLSPEAALAVEDAMQRLTREPEPAESRVDPDSGRRTLEVPAADVDIVYAVDAQAGTIKVFALESRATAPTRETADAP